MKRLCRLLCLAFTTVAALHQPAPANETPVVLLEAIIRDACQKPIVLLGENSHGDGATLALKSQLVAKLVTDCDFDAVFFEASMYDFLEIERKKAAGQTVSREEVSAAMGWIRSRYQETQSLVNFLSAPVQEGIFLGGLDDQLGARGATYGLEQLPHDLVSTLPSQERSACAKLFRQRIWYDFPATAPYSQGHKNEILRCLANSEKGLSNSPRLGPKHPGLPGMLASFRRAIERDFAARDTHVPQRDLSMFKNFNWLKTQFTTDRKIIVWSANSHIARSSATLSEFSGAKNLGTYLNDAYGDDLFSLAFSAAGGTYRFSRQENHAIESANPNSLEAIALSGHGGQVAYIDNEALRKVGEREGSLFHHKSSRRNWSALFDAIVVFAQEHPPKPADLSN